jgi:hypothetical protein
MVLLAAQPPATGAKKKLSSPRYISPAARMLLDQRMERHGEAAMRLAISVVLLEYEESGQVAKMLSEEATLARPKAGELDTLNAQLPARFFELQEELRARAGELADAAAKRNDAAMATAYGKLTSACVSCHSVYLNGK